MACDSSSGSQASAPPKLEFKFVLPSGFRPMSLRGEGSERLSVPPTARITAESDRFGVRQGTGFQLVVRMASEPLSKLKTKPGAGQVVWQSDDVLLFENKQRFSFVVIRDLVPEWDESDRRRLSCSTPGLLGAGAHLATFSQPEVEVMIAACRSLRLPSLD